MACPDSLSHRLPPNSEGQGQNNLYLFNKTLKSIMPCPALLPSPLPFSPALKGLVNVSKLHIRQTSQTINLKDTHRVPAGFFLTPLASVVLTPSCLQKRERRGGGPGKGVRVKSVQSVPCSYKTERFSKTAF